MRVNKGATIALHGLILGGGQVSGGFPNNAGGAIYSDGAGLGAPTQLSLSACTVTNNGADFGGGIFNNGNGNGSATLLLHSCSFYSNSALAGNGGALHGAAQTNGTSYLRVEHCSLISDISPAGSEIFNDSAGDGSAALHLINSSVGGKFSTSPIGESGDIDTITTGANIVTGNGDWNVDNGPTPINSDPMLAFIDYGGSSSVLVPLPGSPVLNTAIGSTRSTDQRGFAITDGAPDIGAIEFFNQVDLPSVLPLVWETDHDGDGNTFGVEFILGTDPFVSDVGHPNNPTISADSDGRIAIGFGGNSDAIGLATLVVDRSIDLKTWAVYADIEDPGGVGNIFGLSGETRSFYRLRAKLVEP